jgi:hypothetical protein
MMKRSTVALAVSAVAIVVLAFVWIAPKHLVYWRSEQAIGEYLAGQTPHGSRESEVVRWLQSEGLAPLLDRRQVPANSSYPPSTKGAASFIAIVLDRYWTDFQTSVEAFYFFDGSGTLVEISVRKSTDSL